MYVNLLISQPHADPETAPAPPCSNIRRLITCSTGKAGQQIFWQNTKFWPRNEFFETFVSLSGFYIKFWTDWLILAVIRVGYGTKLCSRTWFSYIIAHWPRLWPKIFTSIIVHLEKYRPAGAHSRKRGPTVIHYSLSCCLQLHKKHYNGTYPCQYITLFQI